MTTKRRRAGTVLIVAAFLTAAAAILLGMIGNLSLAPYVPLSGALLLPSAALLGWGAGLVSGRAPQGDRQPFEPLSWWWVAAGLLLIIVSMWGSTAVLLAIADTADHLKRAELRLDAVKTGLTVGAGAVGVIALLLSVRRQWLGERTQAYQEYDAAERRVTDLYVKAVDHLGSDSSAVRLGGLHALERVAQGNPEHRQTIVDVICAYLRMPAEPYDDRSNRAPDLHDRQVRLTAQHILTRHVRRGIADGREFWPDLDLDLTRAALVNLDLAACSVRTLLLVEAVVTGGAKLTGARFEGTADFWGATFNGGADFRGAVFESGADFTGARFEGGAVFWSSSFDAPVDFEGAVARDGHDSDQVWPTGWGANSWAQSGYRRLSRTEPSGVTLAQPPN